MSELLGNIGMILITAVVTSGATWFFSRRKNKADIQASSMSAALDAVQIWETTGQKLKNEVVLLREEISHERNERKVWQETAENLQRDVSELTRQVRLLKNSNARLRRILEKAGIKTDGDEES